jgi:hypothetical protein
MAKVITNVYGLAQEIQRQFGCDRDVIEQLCDRFSENVVIAGDRYAVATHIIRVAEKAGYSIDWANPADMVEDETIGFDHILDGFRGNDLDGAGYSYFTIEESIKTVYTPEQCYEIVKRNCPNA